MKELVSIIHHNGDQAVNARELHQFIVVESINNNVGEKFSDWIKRMLDYGFEKGLDYEILEFNYLGHKIRKSDNQRVSKRDYALTLDCAKEISMIQRNDKGKEARRYFIEVEKRARQAIKQLSPAEQLLQNAQLLVEQERKIGEHDNRLNILESKTKTRPDYFTIAGYGNLNGISVNIKIASRLGRAASKICRDKGFLTDEIKDPRFGKVKMYPMKVLDEVFREVTV